jgi:aldehyde dehydrogenase (NAD+)
MSERPSGARDRTDAPALANGTDCGVLAAVWTENAGRLHASGQVGQDRAGVHEPLPRSGHGREKGLLALDEVNGTKTLVYWHG